MLTTTSGRPEVPAQPQEVQCWGRQERTACRGKKRYFYRQEALASAACRTLHSGYRLNFYLCPFCFGYHLTKRK